MWCVELYSRAREVVFTPSVLVPGEQSGEKVPSVHSLSNGLYSFPLCVSVHAFVCVSESVKFNSVRGNILHTTDNLVKLGDEILMIV